MDPQSAQPRKEEEEEDRSTNDEIILAQEQSVTFSGDFAEGETRGKIQGTLILTNRRLLFVGANQQENLLITPFPRNTGALRFANVDDLKSISSDKLGVSVPLDELELEKGREHILLKPSLKIRWRDRQSGATMSAEFVEDIAGGSRKKDLKDWARVIDSLKSGKLKINKPVSPIPARDTLEGRVLYVMGDMQDKGVMQIEEEVEKKYGVDLDPDEVQAACSSLVSGGLLDIVEQIDGESFYRRRSPLGEDDLSS